MSRFYILFVFFLILSCSSDESEDDIVLENSLVNKELVLGNVIACAASNENDDLISVFLFPREGVVNIQYYETIDATVDKNNFENYIAVEYPLLDVFNGFLKKFEVAVSNEKWVIVAFEEDGKTHVSNPIRLKQDSKPTEYLTENVIVNSTSNMPVFTWVDGAFDDTAIYFQVLSDEQNNFISGTYTVEKMFQFYNLDNVVLNITDGTPENLVPNTRYGFSLLAVSEDNWVNLFSEINFELE